MTSIFFQLDDGVDDENDDDDDDDGDDDDDDCVLNEANTQNTELLKMYRFQNENQ